MSRKKVKALPSKKTLNLVIKDRPPHYARKIIIGILVGIILIGAFTKFAVLDLMSYSYALMAKANAERRRYEQLAEANAPYPDVRAEYERYFTYPVGAETFVDAIDVLGIIEDTLMTSAAVQSASLSDNVLSVILTGVSLERASSIVRALYSNEQVVSAGISSADTTVEGVTSSVSMTITFVAGGGADS